MLISLLDEMKNSAKADPHRWDSNLTAEELHSLLSISSLPKNDVIQGDVRHCVGLHADTKKVADYINGYCSGCKLYPPGGFLPWHTNSNHPGMRVYFVYATGEGSWFRYVRDGQEITSPDNPGWNIRAFSVTAKNPFWHCVYAATDRYSFGFNCLHLKDELLPYLVS